MRTVSILGCTGSIGCQALEVCERLSIRVAYMAGGSNVELMAQQIEAFSPEAVSVVDREKAELLKSHLTTLKVRAPEILWGTEGMCELAGRPVDRVIAAVSGFAGLPAVLRAIESGLDIALANKETLVAAGNLVMSRASAKGVSIYPVDSEHSAIWQCLAAAPERAWKKLWLTASGGPFRTFRPEQMRDITPERALKHPVWAMGAKISIDSATMMNKGLELIEAMHLFKAREDEIGIVVHPEGIIHSLVEFKDGELLAQMGNADMRLPIQLSLTWPERIEAGWPRFDFFAAASSPLHFEQPDEKRFPALRLARIAAADGGVMPLVMNAANEVAVAAFLKKQLSFGGIAELTEKAMVHFSSVSELTDHDLNAIIRSDELVRSWCQEQL